MNLGLLLFGVGFFGLMAVVNFWRARRKKEKFYYFAGVASSLMAVACILLGLGHYILTFVLMVFVGVVSWVAFPKTLKLWEREWGKLAQEVDPSARLSIIDFFTSQGLLKLACKWGVGKTVFVLWLLMGPIIGGLLFVLNLWLEFMSTAFIASYTSMTTGYAFIYKYQLEKALKGEKPSEVARVLAAYRSLNVEELYRKLLDMYIRAWGSSLGGIRELENNIQSCMKQGLNREEAIRKVAVWEFEGVPL